MLAMPSATKEPRQLVAVISAATSGGVTALPKRAKECVMPCAKPRHPARVQLDMARVEVGKVAPSPRPKTKRAKISDQNPPASPVPRVATAQTRPHTPNTSRGP